jgi:hypothetical protein
MKPDASPSRLLHYSRFLIYAFGFGLALLLAHCESPARSAPATHAVAGNTTAPAVHHTFAPAPRAK